MKKYFITTSDGNTTNNFGQDSENIQIVSIEYSELPKEQVLAEFIRKFEEEYKEDDTDVSEPQLPYSIDSFNIYEVVWD